MKSQAAASAASAVVAAATGVVTNVLSNNWALTWWLALGALIAVSVILQLAIICWPSDSDTSTESTSQESRIMEQYMPNVTIKGDNNIVGSNNTINKAAEARSESSLDFSAVATFTEVSARPESTAVIDMRLRNLGDQPAILHKATVSVHDAIGLSPHYVLGVIPYEEWPMGAGLHVSETYNLDLPWPEEARGSYDIPKL